MFKVGDEILIKGRILVVDHTDKDYPYEVRIDEKGIENLWVSEDMIAESKTYEQGLADAWELANRIYDMKCDAIEEIFGVKGGFYEVIRNFTFEDCRDKIEAYEKEKEIKVGDVVEDEEGTKALVIDEATENTCFVFTENGCVEDWYKMDLKKTGKKISIESLLRQIGE